MPSRRHIPTKPNELHPETARAISAGNLKPWPAPPKGNRRSVKHGARARVPDSVMARKVADIYDALAASAPVRDADDELPAADTYAVLMLAQALGRLESVTTYIEKNGAFDRGGNPKPAVRYEAGLRREIAEHLASLGMTPKSRARLGVDLVRQRDLAKEWSSPRPKRRRDAIEAVAIDDDEDD